MESPVEYRDVVGSDAQVVTRHRFDESAGCDAERRAYEAWVATRIATGTYVGRVALVGETVVAGAGVVLLDWGPTRGNVGGICARVVAVYTDPALRRRGLASELVRQAMQRAASLGVRDFRLAASEDGAGMYRQLGFRPYRAEMIFKLEA
jgi:GNAT superfamily N-acetyltransferase